MTEVFLYLKIMPGASNSSGMYLDGYSTSISVTFIRVNDGLTISLVILDINGK